MKQDLLLQLMSECIKTFPTVNASYKYPQEQAINPAYCNIEHCFPLCINDKIIWALRGDLTLALGIKNAYVNEGNTNLLNKIDCSLHQYIDTDDRYGHPSLAMPDQHYDGSVFYAGWIQRHANHLDVFLASGRYQNHKLNALQKWHLEIYLYLKLLNAYGNQTIVFIDWEHTNDLNLFLTGSSLPANKSKRIYSSQIKATLLGMALIFVLSPKGKSPLTLHMISLIVYSMLLAQAKNASQLAVTQFVNYMLSFLEEQKQSSTDLIDTQPPPLQRLSIFKEKNDTYTDKQNNALDNLPKPSVYS